MDTVRLDDGLLRTTAPNGLVVLTEQLPGVRSAADRLLRAHGQRARAPRADGRSPTCSSTWCSRAPSAAPPRSWRSSSRSGAAASTPSPAATTPATRRTCSTPTCRWPSRSSPTWSRRPLLRESDLEPERNVILEEINGVDDTPDDLVFELHAAELWPEHPYGYSILGDAGDARGALGRRSPVPAPDAATTAATA